MINQSLVGRTVEIPLDSASSILGKVTSESEDGRIVVEDDEGEKWSGWEYQVILVS